MNDYLELKQAAAIAIERAFRQGEAKYGADSWRDRNETEDLRHAGIHLLDAYTAPVGDNEDIEHLIARAVTIYKRRIG